MSGGPDKIDDVKYGVGEHAHTMLVNRLRYFNTRAEYHFFLPRVTEEKFSNLPHSWLILDSESTIYIIANKAMV